MNPNQKTIRLPSELKEQIQKEADSTLERIKVDIQNEISQLAQKPDKFMVMITDIIDISIKNNSICADCIGIANEEVISVFEQKLAKIFKKYAIEYLE